MSDAAFKTAKFPGYTTAQLKEFIADPEADMIRRELMQFEVDRRVKVAAGDWSVMTDGERLRHAQHTGRTRAGNCLG